MIHENEIPIEEIKKIKSQQNKDILEALIRSNVMTGEEILDVAIWKLVCNTHNITSNKEERKKIVMKSVEETLNNWL